MTTAFPPAQQPPHRGQNPAFRNQIQECAQVSCRIAETLSQAIVKIPVRDVKTFGEVIIDTVKSDHFQVWAPMVIGGLGFLAGIILIALHLIPAWTIILALAWLFLGLALCEHFASNHRYFPIYYTNY